MTIKKIAQKVLRYLCILIPMSSLLMVPIYLYGDELGEVLIAMFGDDYGLYARPLVISIIYISLLSILLLPKLNKLNQAIWLNKLKNVEIRAIYKTYIYGISSFSLICLVIILKTTFAYSLGNWNWYESRDFIFLYLLAMLCVVPLFHTKNQA